MMCLAVVMLAANMVVVHVESANRHLEYLEID